MSVQIYTSKPMHFWVIQVTSTPRILKFLFRCDHLPCPRQRGFSIAVPVACWSCQPIGDEPTSPTSPLSQIHRVIGSVSWLQRTKGEAESVGSMMSSKRIFLSNFRSSNLRFDGFILLLGMIESAVHSGGLFKLLSRIDFWELCETNASFPVKMYAKGPKSSASSVFNESDRQSGVLNESMNSSLCVGWNSEYESRKTHEGSST